MRKKLIAVGIVFLVLLAGINIVKIIYKDNQAQNAFAFSKMFHRISRDLVAIFRSNTEK